MTCEVNQIFLGEIASVQSYGAFVKIPGCKQQGLVHKSQISSSHVEDVTEVLERGERIWCKIISIGEDGKIALSMKYVNQGSGKDLDPNNVQLQLDVQKKKKYDPKEGRKAIVLEAVYKTVCARCKTPGHMAKDCFTTPDGKQYDLIPEVEDEPPSVASTEKVNHSKPKEQEKKHKLKKSKKKKKSKSKRKESDLDESDSNDEKNKKKKKKSKEQKLKKRKHKDNSSDDSDSSDSSASSSDNKRHSKKCKRSHSRYSN